jgi:hypothetical protein
MKQERIFIYLQGGVKKFLVGCKQHHSVRYSRGWAFGLFIYLLTSAVIYKQEDGSGTLTQHEPITLVTCYKTIKYTQNFTTYNFKYQTRI